MQGDEFSQSQIDSDEPEAEQGGEAVDDTIDDWPDDAVPSVPIESVWVPGEVLGYAKQEKPRLLPGQRRPSKVKPIVGTLAMGAAVGAVALIGSAMMVGTFLIPRVPIFRTNPAIALLIGAILVGVLCALAAVVLGTIGRLNPVGRNAATLGRRVACGIPVALMTLSLISAVVQGDGEDLLRAAAILLFVLIVGVLIILAADAILGTA